MKLGTTHQHRALKVYSAFLILLAITTAILVMIASAYVVLWSPVQEGDFTVMNKNIWMIQKDFQVNMTQIDIIAIQFNVTEQPPSYIARLSLHHNGTEIFVNQWVNLTEDEMNGTWKLIYLTNGLQIDADLNYTLNVKIQKAHIEDDAPAILIADNEMNFKIGMFIPGSTPIQAITPAVEEPTSGGISLPPLDTAEPVQEDKPYLISATPPFSIYGVICLLLGALKVKPFNLSHHWLYLIGVLMVAVGFTGGI